MAKFKHPSKLSKEDVTRLIVRLCEALSLLKDPKEAAEFLQDLISSQEAEMLAKRLKIAEFLMEGKTYSEIGYYLKTSPTTIARVYEWVKVSGGGYRLVFERLPKDSGDDKVSLDEKFNPFSWRNLKKRYPMYYWPQLLLENVIKSAKEDDKKKIKTIIKKMDKKAQLYKRLNKIINEPLCKKKTR